MIRFFNVTLFTILFFSAYAQDEKFAPDDLKADLTFFKEALEEYCPAIDVFHSRDSFDESYNELSERLVDSMNLIQFYKVLNKFGASVKEGHLEISGSRDTSTNIFSGFFDGTFKYFPISIRYIQQDLIVSGNFSPDSSISRGDKILEINGRSADKIIKEIRDHLIVDGDIESAKNQKLQSNFTGYYYWFVDRPDDFRLRLKEDSTDQIFVRTIPAITRDSMISIRNNRYGERKESTPSIDDLYTYTIDSNNIGIINFKTFNTQLKKKYKVKIKPLYNQIFKELRDRNVENLIIDVRNNPGGRNEFMNKLLPFIMKEKRKGIYRKVTKWSGKVTSYKYPKKSKWSFEGDLYILTNGKSFSNGTVLPVYAREYGNALIIGEETAGRYEGFAAGSKQVVSLPNSKIMIGIPRYLIQIVDLNKEGAIKNRGVIPDYPIEYTWDDYIQKRDLEMEQAQSLISAKK